MYEELIERLRNKADTLSYFNNDEDYRAAADAIEELSCMFEKKMHVIENLKDSQHYSGRYIKSLFK